MTEEQENRENEAEKGAGSLVNSSQKEASQSPFLIIGYLLLVVCIGILAIILFITTQATFFPAVQSAPAATSRAQPATRPTSLPNDLISTSQAIANVHDYTEETLEHLKGYEQAVASVVVFLDRVFRDPVLLDDFYFDQDFRGALTSLYNDALRLRETRYIPSEYKDFQELLNQVSEETVDLIGNIRLSLYQSDPVAGIAMLENLETIFDYLENVDDELGKVGLERHK